MTTNATATEPTNNTSAADVSITFQHLLTDARAISQEGAALTERRLRNRTAMRALGAVWPSLTAEIDRIYPPRGSGKAAKDV